MDHILEQVIHRVPPARRAAGRSHGCGVTSVVLEVTESAILSLTVCQATTETCESEVTATAVIVNVAEVCPAVIETLQSTVRIPQVDW